jgi:acyl-CoA synthetase (NDP forming)
VKAASADGQSGPDGRPVSLPAGFFAPARIAIVGASEKPGPAAQLMRTIERGGFSGEILPINPHRDSILGRPAHPSLAAAGGQIDLAIVMVRPELVVGVVADAAASGVRALMVYTAGFAEMGAAGTAAQAEMAAIASAGGVRLLGPNCLGFASPAAGVAALVIPPESLPEGLRPGGAAIISQGGGLMISAMEYGSRIGLGTSLLVSTGNEADVTIVDVLEHAIEDPATRCIGLIAEGIPDGRRFVRFAVEAAARDVRIVALKLGRSRRGAAAVQSHTAALAGAARVFDAACRDAGVAVVETITQLVDHLALLEKRAPSRRRGDLAILTISGGTKILAADLADAYGIPLAQLQDATNARLAAIIPDIGVGENPLDITAAAIEDSTVVHRSVEALAADPAVGAIALVMHLRQGGGSEAHRRLVRAFTGTYRLDGPQLVVISSIPEGLSGYWRQDIVDGPVPFLNGLEALRAVAALDSALRPVPPAVAARTAPPDAILRVVASGGRIVGEIDCQSILRDAEIAVPRGGIAGSSQAAVALARSLGFPVVLKVAMPALAHRSAIGGVRTGLADDDAVRQAYEAIAAAVGDVPGAGQLQSVLVQAEVPGVAELLVGVTIDPQFGAVLTVGTGGVQAEILDDTITRLAPVDATGAEEMLRSLRGFEPARTAAVISDAMVRSTAETIARISHLGAELAPWIDSLEVNPLLITPDLAVAVDGLATLREPDHGTPIPSFAPSQLRTD